jgi:hypothetical protein
VVITNIWLLGAWSFGVISPSCLIEGADNSTNTPGGTFALSDPSLARMSATILNHARHVEFLVLGNIARVCILQHSMNLCCLWYSPNLC